MNKVKTEFPSGLYLKKPAYEWITATLSTDDDFWE